MKKQTRPARQPVHRATPCVNTAPVSVRWPAVDDELLATLPPVLRAIVRALGFGRARELLESRGGAPVWIPIQKQAALGLSPDEMQRLRMALESHLNETRRVTLPKVDKLFLKYRNEQIVRDRGNRTVREIAQSHALTTRQVGNIFAQAEGPVSQQRDAERAEFLRKQSDLFA